MTTYTFIAKPSTQFVNWNDPTVWAGGVFPNAADADVIFPRITTSGGDVFWSVVTVPGGLSFSAHSVSIRNNVLWMFGNLTVSGDFALDPGGSVEMRGGILSVGSLENNGTQINRNGQIFVAGLLTNNTEIVGSGLTITAGSLTNTGLLAATSGDMTVNVTAGGFTNLSGSTLTGGTYQAGGDAGGYDSTLYLNVGGVIATNATDIVLNGGEIASYDTASSTFVPLESSLHLIS